VNLTVLRMHAQFWSILALIMQICTRTHIAANGLLNLFLIIVGLTAAALFASAPIFNISDLVVFNLAAMIVVMVFHRS